MGRISESGPDGTISYTYDNIYQLTEATYPDGTTYTYNYDEAGNRIQDKDRTYTYNNLNQLISASDGTSYTYDGNGNLTEKDENGNITQYEWDANDKLTKIIRPDGSVIQYEYNSEGIREKKVNPDGSEVRYLMDGLAVLCEYDEGLNILREYVPGISIKQNNQTYYYITDRLGSVRYVLDGSGGVVQSYLYSPFGQVNSSSGSLSQPYQYVGGEYYYTEEDTGLKLLGQRWYDSETGRFISRDPLGEEGGLNLYVYVGNNCVNWIDQIGLMRFGWGGEGGIIYSAGIFFTSCCDINCNLHKIRYHKKCWGLYGGFSLGFGGVTHLDSINCPRGLEGITWEASFPVPYIFLLGVDFSFGRSSDYVGGSIGVDAGIRRYKYTIIKDEIIGSCNGRN